MHSVTSLRPEHGCSTYYRRLLRYKIPGKVNFCVIGELPHPPLNVLTLVSVGTTACEQNSLWWNSVSWVCFCWQWPGSRGKNLVSHSLYPAAQPLLSWLAVRLRSSNAGSNKSALTLTTRGVHGGRNGFALFPCGCKLPFSTGNQNFSSPGPPPFPGHDLLWLSWVWLIIISFFFFFIFCPLQLPVQSTADNVSFSVN